MNVQQSAIPVLVVVIPLVTSLVLPVLGWWYRPAVFPVALAGLAVTCGTAIIAAYTVVVGGPLHYYLGGVGAALGYRVSNRFTQRPDAGAPDRHHAARRHLLEA